MIISYDSDGNEFEGFEDFDPSKPLASQEVFIPINKSNKNEFALPLPKNRVKTPAPPEPVKVIQPTLGTEVQSQFTKSDEIIEVNAEVYHQMNQQLAAENMIIRDKSVFNGVGRQRYKSQLTYLSAIDIASRGEAEAMAKHITRSRINSRQMYGW